MGRSPKTTPVPHERNDRRALGRLLQAVEHGQADEINEAFEDIYHTYVRLVAFVCGKYLSDENDVRSVTNDVFVQLFNHLNRLDPDGHGLKYYLAASAKHAALNHLRDQRRHRDALLATEEETEAFLSVPDPDCENPDASLRYRELVRDLSACMDRTALDIVLRHAVMGETFPAIASDLGMKPATVKTVYHRALAAFRREKGTHWI